MLDKTRQTSAKNIEGTLKLGHPFDGLDITNDIKMLTNFWPSMLNAIDEGSFNIELFSNKISLTIHRKGNMDLLIDKTSPWVKWSLETRPVATTGDIPLFGLAAKGRYTETQLKQSIIKLNNKIDLVNIAHVSMKESLTTIFCRDCETAV